MDTDHLIAGINNIFQSPVAFLIYINSNVSSRTFVELLWIDHCLKYDHHSLIADSSVFFSVVG